MGVFAENQPVFDDLRIPTFPVRDKAPPVKGWDKGTPRQLMSRSRAWARHKNFQNDDAFGFLCGATSGITVVDVDTTDENVLANALDRYGPTPLIVRTHSNKFHCYYRHDGETRKIRVPGLGGPVDLLGAGGFAVAPPSVGSKGSYHIVQGTLGDLADLPCMNRLAESAPSTATRVAEAAGAVGPEGQRNGDMFRALLGLAHMADGLATLLQHARAINAELPVPLPDAEISQLTAKAWRYQSEGKNRVGIGQYMMITHQQVDAFEAGGSAGQDANWLLQVLKRECGGRDAFYVANGLEARLGWTLRRLQSARNFLEDLTEIVEVRRYSKKLGPTVYRWRTTSLEAAHAEMGAMDRGRSGAGG